MDNRSLVDNADFQRSLADLDHGLSVPPSAPPVRGPLAPFDDPPQSSPPRARRFVPALEAAASGPPLTYEPFYGLNEPAFSSSPDPKFLYRAGSRERVVQALADALSRGEHLMEVTGEPGVGKTMLCRTLRDALGDRAAVAVVEATDSVDHALRRALTDFGVSADGGLRAASRSDLVQALGTFAASLRSLGSYAVLVVDEAHRMPADVIGALAGLAVSGSEARRVRIVFVGEPTLASTLQQGDLKALDAWFGARAWLEPLGLEELDGYVAHRLVVAGPAARVLFDAGAIAALGRVTGGVPKLVNLVCDRALARGQRMAAAMIGESIVAAVADQLGLGSPRVVGSGAVARVRRTLFLLLLAALGAVAGLWVFRDAVARILAVYR